MAVDLNDLVESLRREVNTPGEDSFPGAFDDTYVGHLQDSFWEIKLDGVTSFNSYSEEDGVIEHTDGVTDLDRTYQQLIVLYAGIRIIRNQLLNLETVFKAQAGSARFETQQSATLLRAILEELKSRRNLVLTRLSDAGATPSYYIDALAARENSIDYGFTFWPSH